MTKPSTGESVTHVEGRTTSMSSISDPKETMDIDMYEEHKYFKSIDPDLEQFEQYQEDVAKAGKMLMLRLEWDLKNMQEALEDAKKCLEDWRATL